MTLKVRKLPKSVKEKPSLRIKKKGKKAKKKVTSQQDIVEDVCTCLRAKRFVYIKGIAYTTRDGVLYAYFKDRTTNRYVFSKMLLNTFWKHCDDLPEKGKETIGHIANEVRSSRKD